MTKQYFDFQKSEKDLQSCERVCLTRFRLESEIQKNYVLQKNLDAFKQDMKSVIKNLSLVFAMSLYADRMNEIDLVEAVYLIEKEDLFDIWTFTKEFDLIAEERIAEAQCELMRIHKDIDFDFMVYPLYEKNICDVLPPNSTQIYPQNGLR